MGARVAGPFRWHRVGPPAANASGTVVLRWCNAKPPLLCTACVHPHLCTSPSLCAPPLPPLPCAAENVYLDDTMGGSALPGSSCTLLVGNHGLAAQLHDDPTAPGGKISAKIVK